MPSCERCWSESGGQASKYLILLGERSCTPEEQAGEDAEWCKECDRKTMHQHCHVCMNPECQGAKE